MRWWMVLLAVVGCDDGSYEACMARADDVWDTCLDAVGAELEECYSACPLVNNETCYGLCNLEVEREYEACTDTWLSRRDAC